MIQSTQIEKYSTQQFGTMLQNSNPNRIVSISWEIGNESENGPTFYVFKDVGEVVNMMRNIYTTSFVLADINDDELYTKENAILQFRDNTLEIRVISYKDEGDTYKFFRNDAYQLIKQNLSHGTIPWRTYSQY